MGVAKEEPVRAASGVETARYRRVGGGTERYDGYVYDFFIRLAYNGLLQLLCFLHRQPAADLLVSQLERR